MNLNTGEALDDLAQSTLSWCSDIGTGPNTIHDVLKGPDVKVIYAIQDGIDRYNKKAASNAQKVQKWTILPKDFTIPTGELGEFNLNSLLYFSIIIWFLYNF